MWMYQFILHTSRYYPLDKFLLLFKILEYCDVRVFLSISLLIPGPIYKNNFSTTVPSIELTLPIVIEVSAIFVETITFLPLAPFALSGGLLSKSLACWLIGRVE